MIAATNMESQIDKALKRPGRFDKIIKLPMPNKYAWEKLIELYLWKV